MSPPFLKLLGLTPDDDNETSNPALTPELRAMKARALQQAGVTPTPKPAQPAQTSDGEGFWDQLKKGAVQNTEKFLNFATQQPQPQDLPEPTTLAGKAGRFVAGAVDPVNVIGFGATGTALDALGVPHWVEGQAAKLAGESLASKLAAKTAAAAGEGALVGGLGSPPTDYLRSVEEGKPYDPSTIPSSMLQGAAMGAVMDPFLRGAMEVPGAAVAGAKHMVTGGLSSYAHDIPEHATWENYDPWDSHTPTQAVPGAGQVNSGLAGAWEPGKLFVQGALKKFGDRMDVGVPTDDSGRHGVAVDLYKTGTTDDPTLSVGFLRHNEDAPVKELNSARPDNVQPEPTPRETMAILKHIKQVLLENPKIKWLDTQPINSSVESFLAKYGGRYEDDATRMVVPADNIRQGLRGEPHPETQAMLDAMRGPHANFADAVQGMHPDPFGRMERAIRKGKDPASTFYGGDWEHRNDTASGANPRDPETGLLAYSGVPVPEITRAAKGFTKGVVGHLEDKLGSEEPKGSEPPTFPGRGVINVEKLPIDLEAKQRLAEAASPYLDLKNSQRTTLGAQYEEAARLKAELLKSVNGSEELDIQKARKLSGVELRARTDANVKINEDIETLAKQMEGSDPTTIEKLQSQIDHLRDVQHVLLRESVVGEGERGRDLRALRYAPDNLTAWLKKAQRATGDGKIPENVDTEIRRQMNKRKATTDPKEQADIDQRLETLVELLKDRPVWDHVSDVYKTLITPPGPTDVGIVAANIAATAADHVTRASAAIFDTMASLFTGERSLAYRGFEGIGTGLRNAGENIKENFRSGKVALADTQFGKPVGENYGLMEKVVSKVPGEHLELAKKAVKLDAMTKVYLKFHWARLGAEHMAFRDVLIAQNLVGEAHVKAINEGLKGDARNARVTEILKDPGQYPTLVARAIADARRAVYVKDNQFSTMIAAAKATAPRGVKQALDLAMPFTKIASNIAEAGIDYTPVVGLLKELTSKSKDQHSIVLALGKQATAGGLMAVAYMLHKQGVLTGAGPTTTAEKQQWENEGRAPYSMLVNGVWRSYERALGPVGWPVGLGADISVFQDNLPKQGPHQSLPEKVNTTLGGYADRLADEIPGGQLSAFSSHKSADPGENFIENLGTQVLAPNILGSANLAKGLDNKERATDTFVDKLKARIPGLRESLPAKLDATGREIPTADNLVGTMLDPTRPHVARQEPALTEMDRLGLNFAKPGTTGTYTAEEQGARFRAGLTPNHIPEHYDRTPQDVRELSQGTVRDQRVIDHLNALVTQPSYQAVPDEIKRAMLTDMLSKLRAVITVQHSLTNPQPLSEPVKWP